MEENVHENDLLYSSIWLLIMTFPSQKSKMYVVVMEWVARNQKRRQTVISKNFSPIFLLIFTLLSCATSAESLLSLLSLKMAANNL